jgi:hypothetical protein
MLLEQRLLETSDGNPLTHQAFAHHKSPNSAKKGKEESHHP